MTRLIIDGNAVYEIDEDCLEAQKKKRAKGRIRAQEQNGRGGGGKQQKRG